MAVVVKRADGSEKEFADVDGKQFSYRTTDAGVLRVVQIEGKKQALALEYSPSAWLTVSGERYMSEIGTGLRTVEMAPRSPESRKMVVL